MVLQNVTQSRDCADCGGDTQESCHLVVAGACLGLVGLACDAYTDGENDQTADVAEAYLTPVR